MIFYMFLHRIFNNQQFSTLFDNAGIGIIVVNADGEIEAANKHILHEFGYNETELRQQQVEFLIPERFREKHRRVRAQFSRNPVNIAIAPEKNLKGIRKDGSELPVEISLGYYQDNEDTYYVAFVYDLRKNKEAEETIKQLNDELDQRVKEGTRSLRSEE